MLRAAHHRGVPSLLARENAAHAGRFSGTVPLRFRAAPLLFAAAAFACGILLAHWWRPAATLVVADVLLLTVALLAIRRAPRLALPVYRCHVDGAGMDVRGVAAAGAA